MNPDNQVDGLCATEQKHSQTQLIGVFATATILMEEAYKKKSYLRELTQKCIEECLEGET